MSSIKKSQKAAFAGIISALSLILLALGAAVWIFSYIAPILCGLLMIILIESFDYKTAFTVYAAVSVLSMILLSDKETALLYVMFFGYYPMLKVKLERLKNKALRAFLKFLVFNAGIIGAELLCFYVFSIPFDNFLGKWSAAVLLLLSYVILFVFDRLLGSLTFLYNKKYKNKIDKFLK